MVPTTDRTICWQNDDASISKRSIPSPRSDQSASRTRRTSEAPATGGPAAERREVVLAVERVAGQPHGPQVERRGDVPGRGGQERVGHRPVEHGVAVAPAGGRPAGVEAGRGHDRGRAHDDGRAQGLVDRPLQAAGSTSARASKLTTWPQAWTPASVRPAQVSSTVWRRWRSRAPASAPATVRWPGWAAKPWNPAPR